jgi:hypothetical protein
MLVTYKPVFDLLAITQAHGEPIQDPVSQRVGTHPLPDHRLLSPKLKGSLKMLDGCSRAYTKCANDRDPKEGETMGGESQAFPELNNLWIVIEEFPYEDFIFGNVQLILHRPEGEAATHSYHFPRLIRDYDRDDPWMDYAEQFIEQDLFTPSEVAAIEAYFSRRAAQGMTLHKERQAFPIVSDQVPCNAAGYGGWDGEYLFDTEEGFDCPIKFWGYYWLGGSQAISRPIHVKCGSDGTLSLSSGADSYLLGPSQAAMLLEGWMRAKTVGQEETFTIQSTLLPLNGMPRRTKSSETSAPHPAAC